MNVGEILKICFRRGRKNFSFSDKFSKGFFLQGIKSQDYMVKSITLYDTIQTFYDLEKGLGLLETFLGKCW